MNNLDPQARIFVHVSIKLLLRKSDQILLLESSTQAKRYDLPGGRINCHEWENDFKEILAREVTEEIGADVAYTLLPQQPSILRFTSRNGKFDDGTPTRAIVLLYEGEYISGDITLSAEHASFQWFDAATLNTTDSMVGDDFGKQLNDYIHAI